MKGTNMVFTVLNGSPKGENSITLQTVKYLQIRFPEHEFNILHAGQKIRKYEKDFTEAKAALEAADVIVFCYPVYTFVVPSQLHRFVELMKESGVDLKGKYSTQILTSKHFYDITAMAFIDENAKDMGMKIIPGHTADMDDILTDKGRHEAMAFFDHLLWSLGQTE